ncbi:MAG: peptide-N-glycosidase F-related protein [Bacteroidia bacterium]
MSTPSGFRLSFFAIFIFLATGIQSFAKDGDTVKITTFTFGSPQDSVFLFPSDTVKFEKILMRYTLKCNPKQSPACGEWDYLTYTYAWKDSFRYELARYITPYGIGLSLGNGWTWTFDVSDYRTLLADSVRLQAGNWQELLQMEFWMIKGTPPRDVLAISNLSNGNYNYGLIDNPINTQLTGADVEIPENVKGARIKSRITGHGFGDGTENCAEFCAKKHFFKVDGTQRFEKLVWRDNCGLNPLYPQGGTWVYNRANWCPGAEVWTYDFELTPYIKAGETISVQHQVQNDYEWNGQGSTPYYAIADQVVFYGAPNFRNDAAVVDVIAPSNNQMYARMNPVCSQPIIRIKNTGHTPLTSLTIFYGMGYNKSKFYWTGELAFMEEAEVKLGAFEWNTSGIFEVFILEPNGVLDEYAPNNTFSTYTDIPQVFPEKIIVEVKTNTLPDETSYTLTDVSGKTILSRSGLSANTTYRDTLTLPTGCYEFRLKDGGNDGLKWWANTAQGTGFARIKRENGTVLKNFNADFGAEIYQSFSVGSFVGFGEKGFVKETELKVYPNPSNGQVHININFTERKTGNIEIRDITGKKVYNYTFQNSTAEGIDTDLKHLPAGIYMAIVNTGCEVQTQKFIISK